LVERKLVEFDILWKREYSFLYSIACVYSLQNLIREELGIEAVTRMESPPGWAVMMLQKGAINQLKEKQDTNLKEKPAQVHKELEKLHSCGQKLIQFAKNIHVSRKNTDLELMVLLQQFLDLFIIYCNHLFRSFLYVNNVALLFEEKIKDKFPAEDLPKVIEAYSIPSQKAAALVVQEYFNKEKRMAHRIEFMKKNYPWFNSGDPFKQSLDTRWINHFVKSFSVESKKKVHRSWGLEKDEFIALYQEILYIKDKRDEYRREAFYYLLPLLKEISRRVNISVQDLGYLLPHEILEKNRDAKIEQRKIAFTLELRNMQLTIIAGKNAREQFIHPLQIEKVSLLQGTVCSSGFVTGKVQIIRGKEDIIKFKQGNVLVAVTTDPNHLPAMQKAIAFITDEGGITCHAAIVARELGKPAIVGTKTATSVLKNGDIVEVDAEKGIIRVVK